MQKTITYLIMLLPLSTIAQNKGQSLLFASHTSQYYYDKGSVRVDGKSPDNIILPQNTYGYAYGLHYERRTRWGLLIDAGIQYGMRKYDVDVVMDLSNFDPEAKLNLAGQFFRDNIAASIKYVAPKIMIGYRMELSKKLAISAKAGVTEKRFFRGLWETRTYDIKYTTDDLQLRDERLLVNVIFLGGNDIVDRGLFKTKYFPIKIYSCDFYIGVDYNVKSKYAKSIAVGIEASRNWWMWRDSDIMVSSKDHVDKTTIGQISNDGFLDRNLSLGLRVGVGLWN